MFCGCLSFVNILVVFLTFICMKEEAKQSILQSLVSYIYDLPVLIFSYSFQGNSLFCLVIWVYAFQLARLPQDDMNAVYNMRLLEAAQENKKSSIVPFSLKFDVHKVKESVRRV